MDIFLKGLPSYNVENFARFQVDHNSKNSTAKRPPTFTSSKDHPKEQVIVTETHRNLVELIARISNKKRSIIRSADTDEEEDRGRPCKIARVENVNSFHKD